MIGWLTSGQMCDRQAGQTAFSAPSAGIAASTPNTCQSHPLLCAHPACIRCIVMSDFAQTEMKKNPAQANLHKEDALTMILFL